MEMRSTSSLFRDLRVLKCSLNHSLQARRWRCARAATRGRCCTREQKELSVSRPPGAGTTLEMHKRRFAGPLLYALAGVQAAQLAFLCYATWVVAAALVPGCAAERGLHALVNASWALLAAVWSAFSLCISLSQHVCN